MWKSVLIGLCGVLLAQAETAPLAVGLYADRGCRGNGVARWAELLDGSPDLSLRVLSGADIRAGGLDGLDLLVMPGGAGGPQYQALGDAGAERVRAFVAAGGRYFGTCCGLSITLNEELPFAKRLKMLPFKNLEPLGRGGFTSTILFNEAGADYLGLTPGDRRAIRYHNGPILGPADPVPGCSNVTVLATMNGELSQFGPVTGSAMFGTPAVVRADYGKGKMLAFNCHPEVSADSRDLVFAGLRALTGREVRPPAARSSRGRERVGIVPRQADWTKPAVERYLKLLHDPAVFVTPFTKTELEQGAGAAMDRILDASLEEAPIRGPFPLMCTPWTAEATLDCTVLANEAAFMNAGGVAGIVWPTAPEVAELVEEGEYVKGLTALAERSVKDGFTALVTAICCGRTSDEALARVREATAVMEKTGAKMAILARPPDDAKTQAEIEAHYRALAQIAKCPVIIQTYNGTSPQPDVSLLVKLSADYPDIYGYVKEESPGGQVNARIAELVAAKPAIKTVFSGWGAKGWLYQGRTLGTEGIITQRPAYADLLARLWAEEQKGDPDGKLTDLYASTCSCSTSAIRSAARRIRCAVRTSTS